MKIKQYINKKNIPLKLLSFIFGFLLWALFIVAHVEYHDIVIPLSFYGSKKSETIDSPHFVVASLVGKRIDCNILQKKNLTVHIDASRLEKGENRVNLYEQQLFLPESLKLLNYTPSSILVYKR